MKEKYREKRHNLRALDSLRKKNKTGRLYGVISTFCHLIGPFASLPLLFSSQTYNLCISMILFWSDALKNAYIHVQRVEICQNQYFVFGCTSLSVLTFFSTVNSTGRWWCRTMNSIPTPSYLWGYSHAKLQGNWIKTVAVTVRPFLIKMATMTSFNYAN